MASIREFRLPDLGEGLEEGEILQWLVQEGDDVALNQTLVEIETAKAVVEVPCPFAGRVVELIGSTGEVLPVGTVILRIDVAASDAGTSPDQPSAGAAPTAAERAATEPTTGTGLDADKEPQPLVGYGQTASAAGGRWRGSSSAPAPAAPAATVPTPAPAPAPAPAVPTAPAGDRSRPLAKPPVRKRARDLGIDLATIAPGTGPRGEVTRADLERAVADAPAQATPASAVPDRSALSPEAGFRGYFLGQRIAVRGVRKHIAEKMTRSRSEIPFASCSRDVDLTELLAMRERLNRIAGSEGHAVRVTPFAVILRATVAALRRFPILNSTFDAQAQEIRIHDTIDLGFAVDSEHGLFVPIIRQAERRSTLGIAAELLVLADRAREGRLAPQDITGGTFTVSNYGAFGNDDGEPIINHPQAAILGVGAIRSRPWVVDGEVVVRDIATLRLVFDHRVCDGGEAGRFVNYLGELCEDPAGMLLHS
jgi:2-oxoisovalerate dehydrogenase E2 component (dihydrolipoyl transacylase)